MESYGELGVEIACRCFFMYKGNSLEYTDADEGGFALDTVNGGTLRVRRVDTREFSDARSDTCRPCSLAELPAESEYTAEGAMAWQPLCAPPKL